MSQCGEIRENPQFWTFTISSRHRIDHGKIQSANLVIIDTDAHQLARRAVERTVERFPVDEILIYGDDPAQWPGSDQSPSRAMLQEKILSAQ